MHTLFFCKKTVRYRIGSGLFRCETYFYAAGVAAAGASSIASK